MASYKGLDPEFVQRLKHFEAEMKNRGIPVRITSGFRTFEEQDALYAQGRTKRGPIVTNSRGGWSWHNYGLAADYAFVQGNGLVWNGPWRIFGAIARNNGLEWGGDWKGFKDRPHLQLTRGHTLKQMLKAHGKVR